MVWQCFISCCNVTPFSKISFILIWKAPTQYQKLIFQYNQDLNTRDYCFFERIHTRTLQKLCLYRKLVARLPHLPIQQLGSTSRCPQQGPIIPFPFWWTVFRKRARNWLIKWFRNLTKSVKTVKKQNIHAHKYGIAFKNFHNVYLFNHQSLKA